MNDKTHIYFVPGMAANARIFEFLRLPNDKFELHYIDWLIPEDDEDLISYVKRMKPLIEHSNPVLIGVSFGGIIVQELSRLMPVRKVIIISSVKTRSELPKRLLYLKKGNAFKLLPTKTIAHTKDLTRFPLPRRLKRKAELYNKYLSVRNEKYLNWSVRQVLFWQNSEYLENVIHIHGTKDEIFPSKRLTNFIPVEGGNHAMILTKANKISKILEKVI